LISLEKKKERKEKIDSQFSPARGECRNKIGGPVEIRKVRFKKIVRWKRKAARNEQRKKGHD